ncbi:pentapeptide repeat-containing protein [Candidatus Babeliales bacterium]|nr:pentapeptide repeat-containing protein [Candidatus Babeliales bacterium]
MKKILNIFMLLLLSITFVYTYNSKDLEQAKSGNRSLSGKNLSHAYLANLNLRYTKLNSSDLHNANLSGSYLYGSDLTNAKVEKANFKGVTGLTNKQKGYLYAHGAINIPPYNPNETPKTDPHWLANICNEKIDTFMKAVFKKSFHFFISLPKHVKKQIIDRFFLSQKIEKDS